MSLVKSAGLACFFFNLFLNIFRFCFDKFAEKYKATIGVDFEIENFNVLGQSFTLEM